MKQTTTLVLPDHAPLVISKDMNGYIVLEFPAKGARLAPHQAYVLACGILRAIGAEVNEHAPEQQQDVPGPPLPARIKLC